MAANVLWSIRKCIGRQPEKNVIERDIMEWILPAGRFLHDNVVL